MIDDMSRIPVFPTLTTLLLTSVHLNGKDHPVDLVIRGWLPSKKTCDDLAFNVPDLVIVGLSGEDTLMVLCTILVKASDDDNDGDGGCI